MFFHDISRIRCHVLVDCIITGSLGVNQYVQFFPALREIVRIASRPCCYLDFITVVFLFVTGFPIGHRNGISAALNSIISDHAPCIRDIGSADINDKLVTLAGSQSAVHLYNANIDIGYEAVFGHCLP